MKVLNRFLILLMLAIPFVGFTGCGDDDDDNGDDYASAIAGTYNGQLKTAAGDVFMESATITIERTGDNMVTLKTTMTVTIPPLIPNPTALPIECKNTVVAKDANGKYTVAGTTTAASVINVVISGTIDTEGKADINIAVAATTPPINLSFIFSGTKSTAK